MTQGKLRSTSSPSILADLALFERVAYWTEVELASFRAIADKLSISVSALTDALKRLDDKYGEVMTRAKGMAGRNEITPIGRKVLEQVAEWQHWNPKKPSKELRLAISHSLLSDNVLRPVMADFLSDFEHRVNLNIRLRSQLDFDRAMFELSNSEIDLAIYWATPYRLHDRPDIEHRLFEGVIDVVFIARDEDVIERLESTGRIQVDGRPVICLTEEVQAILSQKRIAALGYTSQVYNESLPFPDQSRGGQRIEVDSLDAVVGLVSSHLADIGLIPAIYAELDRSKSRGQLIYSRPVVLPNSKDNPLRRGASLTAFMRKPSENLPDPAKHLLERSLAHWSDSLTMANRSAVTLPFDAEKFSDEPEWYERLRFGYFIDIERGGATRLRWNWEEIWLKPVHSKAGDAKIALTGVIRNSLGDLFDVTGELVGDRNAEHHLGASFFILRAATTHEPKGSTANFISVFTWCSQREGILVGSWSGTDPKQKPAVYATIFSQRRLPWEEVARYARSVLVRSGLNSESPQNFEYQPESRGDEPVLQRRRR